MDPVEMLALGATVFIASAFQGFLGFGFALVATPLVATQTDVVFAAGIVNLTGLMQSGLNAWVLRGDVDRAYFLRCLPLGIVGLVGGTFLLGFIPERGALALLGAVTLGIAVANLRPVEAAHAPRVFGDGATRLAGLGAGLLAGLFNTPGPPIVADLYRRPLSPDAIRGTMITLLLTFMALRLPIAFFGGQLTGGMGMSALLLTPAVALGLLAGLMLGRRVSSERFRRASWFALGAVGLSLLLRFAIGQFG